MWILLKNTEPGHSKFYEMLQIGTEPVVNFRYGKIIQRASQVSGNINFVSGFDSFGEAVSNFNKTLRDKLRKGYVLVSSEADGVSEWNDSGQLGSLDEIATVTRSRMVPSERVVEEESSVSNVREFVRNDVPVVKVKPEKSWRSWDVNVKSHVRK